MVSRKGTAAGSNGLPVFTPSSSSTNPFPAFGSLAGRDAYLMEMMRTCPADERRQGRRRSLHCSITMIAQADKPDMRPKTIPGEAVEIGDGGLYAIIPIGFGVTIGQHYTFQLSIGERGPEPGAGQLVTQQGRVVRTELLISQEGQGDRLGIAVRLLGQRCGMVPMPDRF